MKTRNLGVVMEQGADFSLVIGIKGVDGPIDITGYSFLGEMRSTTDPSSPIAGGVKATGSFTLTANPAPADTLTVNGTLITFVAATPGAGEVLIGASALETACALEWFLRGSSDVNIAKADYCREGLVFTVTYDVVGLVGNAFTLVAASTAITLSGATLTDGIDPAEFVFTILNQFTKKGKVQWSLPQAQVDTIGASVSNPLQRQRLKTPYVFDVKMKDTDGLITRIIQGIIYYSPQAANEVFP